MMGPPLGPTTMLILRLIAEETEDGIARLKYREIAEILNVKSDGEVSKMLRVLRERGYINSIRDGYKNAIELSVTEAGYAALRERGIKVIRIAA